jgi:signal transduction histidine kinase
VVISAQILIPNTLLMQPNGLPLQSLALEPAIDSHFLTVAPDTPLVDVLALMSQFRSCTLLGNNWDRPTPEGLEAISCICQGGAAAFEAVDTAGDCVLVMEEGQLVGIFTERDVVRLTAAGIPLGQLTIADLPSREPVTLKQSQAIDIFTALGLFRQHRIRHLPIVDEAGHPLGIVTHDSIRRALQPVNLLTRLRYVKDVMKTQVIHAPQTVSVLALAQLMTEYQVSCVVITREERGKPEKEDVTAEISVTEDTETQLSAKDWPARSQAPVPSLQDHCQGTPHPFLIPVGIVTERDIVQFQALELNLSRMSAQEVMSTPLFCLRPTESLWSAHEEMQRRHVRRLVVTGEEGELRGIVSQTSLLQVLNPADMYGAIEVLQQAVEARTSELKATNEQLRHEIAERQRAEAELLQARDRLQIQVEERTAELSQANRQLKQDILEREKVEAALRRSEAKLKKQAMKLRHALQELRSYQTQLIQTEKMSSLGQLVAGVAHEINNPINFIFGNITYASQYVRDLMHLLELYDRYYPQPPLEIQHVAEQLDLEFLKTDLPKLIESMRLGTDRIRDLVVSLRNFSRLDQAEMKSVDLHEGLESTLLILKNRLKAAPGRSEIQVIKEYGNLPLVECYPGQLNQVFMNLLSNAIDALEEARSQLSFDFVPEACPLRVPTIAIRTQIKSETHSESIPQTSSPVPYAMIQITDNGTGMTEVVRQHLFDPFFTTKSVGKGTGLGLSISYQIVVEKHGGQLWCHSRPGQGTEFWIKIPIRQCDRANSVGENQLI